MSDHLNIRPLETGDCQAVADLWREVLPSSNSWNEPTRVICRKRNQQDNLILIAEQNGQLVAAVMAGYDGVRGWIYSLAVSPRFQRQGIGRRLLKAAEEALAARGCPKINLQVVSANSQVVRFYEACGFAAEERLSLGKSIDREDHLVADPVPTIQLEHETRLTQLHWDDQGSIIKYLNQTETFHNHIGVIPYPYTELDAQQWMTKSLRTTLRHDRCRHWAIRPREGEAIGGIGLNSLTPNESAEIGYWLAQPFWGRGIVTSAVDAVCRFGFDEYGLQKIYARVLGCNPGSQRVLEKCGFLLEGKLRQHHYQDGHCHDLLYYGKLHSDAERGQP